MGIETIKGLVDRFETHRDSYTSGSYNETQLRREFLDPFFKALGWDVFNEKGYDEAYKEVIHEDSLKIGESTKAPDYCFRIGGVRKFFVEAKKPSVNVKEDVSPAYQLRRYAWNADLPLSILTDFEEFAVYDCREKPALTDKASRARVLYLPFHEYPERWEELAALFSPEAVLKGSFDRYARSAKAKRGTAGVDDAFLEDIERWRELLARGFALRNPALSTHTLNFAVQRTIDRIIFLRIAEDRGLEPYGTLLGQINGEGVYPRLVELFRKADQKYNSGLFHFQNEKGQHERPDDLTPRLHLDDKPLKAIIQGLYYPESPYEFSVMPADILGQVYERFLGKVIRLTAGHQAKVEEKPEVKKAGGVFYTPTFIVDYIVRHTVGRLLEGKTPKQISSLRILDPACGSGSFLLGAYQCLLDWHRDWYLADGAAIHPKEIYRAHTGQWRLTTPERKRILLNSIHGVDLDPQAVEVTKLSLLLKVLEGETEQTLQHQMDFMRARALPDLGRNIQWGNSLIGGDYTHGRQLDFVPEEERYRVNPFDWARQFSAVMEAGGFDAVIGNPPYVRQETLGDDFKAYAGTHFKTFAGTADLYVYFIERGISLLKDGGIFSYIVANKWLRAAYGKPLRQWLKDKAVEEIVDFGDLPVFQGATTYPCILRVAKSKAKKSFSAAKVPDLEFTDLEEKVKDLRYTVEKTTLSPDGWSLADAKVSALLGKIKAQGIPLKEYVKGKIYRGVLTGFNEAFVIDEATKKRLIQEDPKSAELIKPFLQGRDIKRYQPPTPTRYLIFTRRGVDIKRYPAIERHLLQYKELLMPKPKNWKGKEWKGRKPGAYQWYEIQDSTDYYSEFEKPKILWPEIAGDARFTFDPAGCYANNKVFLIPSEDKYLLGLLNSSLLKTFIHSVCTDLQGSSFNFSAVFVQKTPIVVPDLKDKTRVKAKEEILALVDQLLKMNADLATCTSNQQRVLCQRYILAHEKQINNAVCSIYRIDHDDC